MDGIDPDIDLFHKKFNYYYFKAELPVQKSNRAIDARIKSDLLGTQEFAFNAVMWSSR